MKNLFNVFETPLGIIKVLIIDLLSVKSTVKLPPILAKLLFHSSFGSRIDISDDLVRYASKEYIIKEFEIFFKLFRKKNIQVLSVTVLTNNIEGLETIKDLLQLYKKYIGKVHILKNHFKITEEKINIYNRDIRNLIYLDRKNYDLINKDNNKLYYLFDYYYDKSDIYTCLYIEKKMKIYPLNWYFAESIGHINHLLGKQNLAEKFLKKSIELNNERAHRAWCGIGLIANRYSNIDRLDYSLKVFSKAVIFLNNLSLNKSNFNYEKSVILNAKAYSLYKKKEFYKCREVITECVDLLKNVKSKKSLQFKAVVLDNYAMIEFAEKNFEKAQFFLSQAIKIYNKYHRYHYHMGMIKLALDNYQGAITHLRFAKELSHSNVAIVELLVEVLEKSGLILEANIELEYLCTLVEQNDLYKDRIILNKAFLGETSDLRLLLNKYGSIA